MTALAGAHVLSVGEVDGFLRSGGIINFVLEAGQGGRRVHFAINAEAAKHAGLTVSPKLLRLASATE